MHSAPNYLRTEYHVDPLGLDTPTPRLSWLLNDSRLGARQMAYQILAATSLVNLEADIGDLWDSGRVPSSETAQVTYRGRQLQAFDRVVWKVRVWDSNGEASPWSESGRFEIGPLTIDDWGAGSSRPFGDWDWATLIQSRVSGDAVTSPPSPYLRRSFDLPPGVENARLYISALGLYEAWLNGSPVTHDVYRPGWTDYRQRVPYQAYDVTELLITGENVIGAILGDGWYCGFVGFPQRQLWGDRPKLIAKLQVEFADKSQVIVVSDEQWQATTGPILCSDNYNGEVYDARLDLDGWCAPGYDASSWDPVEVLPRRAASPAALVATTAPAIRRTAELLPVARLARTPTQHQFDLGQNITGRARLTATAPAGTGLELRFAEMLNPDGTLHLENLAGARAADRYVCRGGATETFEPRFTFHGFRYVEVTGPPEVLPNVDIVGIVLNSDAPTTGEFSCSNELVTKLQRNITWSQRGNFFDVPIDCPQRAERLGWTGDIQIFARTATYNMDCAAFLAKYSADLRDGQFRTGVERGTFPMVVPSLISLAGGPGWADAGVVIPWIIYERYGDTRVLEEHYSAVREYVRFLERACRGETPGTWAGFGDWLSLDVGDNSLDNDALDPRFGGTPRPFLWHVFDIHATDLAAKIAAVLGESNDANRFERRAAERRAAFAKTYLKADGHVDPQTQTALSLIIDFDILEDQGSDLAAHDLVTLVESKGHLETGFLGTPHLLPALTKAGRTDLAYQLLERTSYPGWLFPVTQGATTIWERWDAWTESGGFNAAGMNSFNHYAYGAVGEWLYQAIAGIDTSHDAPGFSHILIYPRLGGTLTHARAQIDTIRGRVVSAWALEGSSARMNVCIPPNCTATIRFPTSTPEDVSERTSTLIDAEGLTDVTVHRGRVECHAGAGDYHFLVADPIVERV